MLLAAPVPGPAETAHAREQLLAGEGSFADLLGRLGVRLDTGRLRYWAWWVTPEEEPRRYDTRFFVAGVPAGAAVTAHLAEAERERWLPPAVAAADQGMPMLPPTRYTLRDLAPFATVEEALAGAEGRRVERICRARGRRAGPALRERYPVPVPLADPAGRRHERPRAGHGSRTRGCRGIERALEPQGDPGAAPNPRR